MTEPRTNASRIRALNAAIRYAMWSVFRVDGRLGPAPREDVVAEAEALLELLAGKDVVVRGSYDVSALRADAGPAPAGTSARRSRSSPAAAARSARSWPHCHSAPTGTHPA
jgi:hypothetical protein